MNDESPTRLTLPQLGWKGFFQQQLTLEELGCRRPARVFAQHRSEVLLATEDGLLRLPVGPSWPPLTTGDWLLLDLDGNFERLLERASLFSRRAAGEGARLQLIAANVDTLFIVSALNEDFKLNRFERYLALAHEAGVTPVVVLTRADLCDDTERCAASVRALDPGLVVEAVNALDADSIAVLKPWCGRSETVALLGSSGVGKSTLVNTLCGEQGSAATGAIREADGKGRHTTTARSLHPLPDGGLLLDTPGMRELQLSDCEDGLHQTFSDIAKLAQRCRFGNCQHESEPGCAVLEALADGKLDARRLGNYRKLLREQAMNAATIAERRASDRELGKYYRSVLADSRARKKGE